MEVCPIPRRRLGSTGIDVTLLGFGGGPIGNLRRAVSEEDAICTIAEAWARGVRYFDTAPLYGHGLSERRIGKALATQSRSEFVVSTKVGRLVRKPKLADYDTHGFVNIPDLEVIYDYSYDGVMQSIDESMARLQLDYIDIALIHDIDVWTHAKAQEIIFQEALDGAYRALHDLRDERRIRAIGLGVNEWEVCLAFANRAPIDCVLLAGRYTLLEQDSSREFFPYCAERNIGVIIGAPFNSGILATGAGPSAFYNYRPAPQSILERTTQLEKIASEFGVSLYTAALNFPLRHPAVSSVIPGLQTKGEVQKAICALGDKIPDMYWQALENRGLLHTL